MGYYQIDEEIYGKSERLNQFSVDNDEDELFCRDMVDAGDVTPKGFKELDRISDEAIKQIIVRRYRNTIYQIKNRYEDFTAKLIIDFALIDHFIRTGRDLSAEDLDASIIMGEPEKLVNISGLLDEYENSIRENRMNNRVVRYNAETDKNEPVINPTTKEQYRALDLLVELRMLIEEHKHSK